MLRHGKRLRKGSIIEDREDIKIEDEPILEDFKLLLYITNYIRKI